MKEKSLRIITIAMTIVGLIMIMYPMVESDSIEGEFVAALPHEFQEGVTTMGLADAHFIRTFDDDQIDQNNFHSEHYLNWCGRPHEYGFPSWFAQQVTNERGPMEGFTVYVSRTRLPSRDLFFGIMTGNIGDPSKSSSWDWNVRLKASQLPNPNTQYFITIDFSDYDDTPVINANEPFYIVFYTEQDKPNSEDGAWKIRADKWGWDGGPSLWWQQGWFWIWSWHVYESHGWQFITYTTHADNGNGNGHPPPPDEPSISITTQKWVMTTTGLGLLGAAFVVGSKSFGLI